MNPLETQVDGSHYKDMPIQPIEFCMANGLDACQSNILKYVCRFRSKGGIKDLEKARHFLDILIKLETDKAAAVVKIDAAAAGVVGLAPKSTSDFFAGIAARPPSADIQAEGIVESPAARTGITPDPDMVVALALNGSLGEKQTAEVMTAAFPHLSPAVQEVPQEGEPISYPDDDIVWHSWSGDFCPVDGEIVVEVEYANHLKVKSAAGLLTWGRGNDSELNIIKYRVIYNG